MNGLNYRLAALILLLVCAGCVSSKKLTERGDLANREGLYKEASQYYLEALQKELHNEEARRGLRRSGQQYLDVILGDFYKASASGDRATAVYAYRTADELYKSAANVSVRLERPAHYQTLYDDIFEEYKQELYDRAVARMDVGQFDEAKQVLNELYTLDGDYRDTPKLRQVVVLEPLYMQASQAMQYGRYREAVSALDRIEGIDPAYKDASAIKTEAEDQLMLTVAMLPFHNLTRERMIEDKLAAYVLGSINDKRNPYIKVVDRQHTQYILQEQKMGMSGLFDQKTAAQAGRLIGVKSVLIGKVISFSVSKGNWQQSQKEGYAEYYTTDPYTKDKQRKFRDTTYVENVRVASARMSFQYLLISSETGEILGSDILTKETKAEEGYITYKGDKDGLYPKKNGRVLLSGEEKSRLDDMIEHPGGKGLHMESLSTGLFEEVSADVAKQLDKYERSRQ
ncbi:CsgG/HfaB family protein [Roseivirga sp. BDSF3-8]|uniref:CsgG/HfaB family protein n=1 Tax=Roseivirga sp. BDSF3-8 TaxID=3241598 RepID=UPI0035321D1D